MEKTRLKNKLARFAKLIYLKIFRINSDPHKIAFGFALGIFTGVLPGTGPIAALFLAVLFRANRAAALLGSVLTNTWTSLIIFLLSIKAGSAIMGLDWHNVYSTFKVSALKVILPVIIGYLIISACLGVAAYAAVFITVKTIRRKVRRENIRRR